MKITTKTRYGLRAMIELSMADAVTGLLQKEIADKQNISYKYLDHIISSLKLAGLIQNVNGKKSGYILSKSPKSITLYDIYKTFESDLNIVECLCENKNCKKEHSCSPFDLWNDLNNHIGTYMKSITLETIVNAQRAKNNKKEEIMYFI